MRSAADTIQEVLSKAPSQDAKSTEAHVNEEIAASVAQEGLLTQLRDTVRGLEESQKALTARRQELRGQLTFRKCRNNPKAAAEYCGDVLASCVFRECVLGALAQYTPSELRSAYIDDGVEIVRGWGAFAAQVEIDLPRLEQLTNIPLPLSARRVSESYAKAKSAWTLTGDSLLHEYHRRQNIPTIMERLRTDQSRLLQWCRQQKAALEALSTPRAVQEYCASFHTSVSVMESNVLVLLELAEEILPDMSAQELLVDVLAAWTTLVIYAYERLEGALRDMHALAAIEGLAARWGEQGSSTKAFLERAMSLLRMPTDDESVSLTLPSVRKCEALLASIDSFNILMQHIATYSQRDKCVQEMFAALKKSLVAKVTPQTLLYSHTGMFIARQLYANRLAELSDWVQAHTASGAWRAMLVRVEEIKKLIDRTVASEKTDDA